MSGNDRGGLKAAFSKFANPDVDKEAELKLLGRTVEEPAVPAVLPQNYQVATPHQASSGLTPKPLLHREAVRQLSFRCPVSIAIELKRKAAFNQLEQQEIIIEGIKRVIAELSEPPSGWES